MAVPVGVPSDAKPNSINHENFYNEVKKSQNRLDKIERGSIRSGSVGGAGFSFYGLDANGAITGTTAKIGEFEDFYYDSDAKVWVPSRVRGLSLFEAGYENSWFSAATIGDIQTFNVGYSGRPTESVLLRAKLVRLDSEVANGTRLSITEDGGMHFYRESSYIQFHDLPLVGAGDHLVLDGEELKKISSSIRYKQDVEDAVIAPEDVLLMQGRTWRDRNEVAENPDTDRRFVGFIADELAEIPTLRQFVRFNEDDEPETIHYDRLTVGLVELAKTQQTQLNEQKEQIDLLTEKLNQLQDMVESIL